RARHVRIRRCARVRYQRLRLAGRLHDAAHRPVRGNDRHRDVRRQLDDNRYVPRCAQAGGQPVHRRRAGQCRRRDTRQKEGKEHRRRRRRPAVDSHDRVARSPAAPEGFALRRSARPRLPPRNVSASNKYRASGQMPDSSPGGATESFLIARLRSSHVRSLLHETSLYLTQSDAAHSTRAGGGRLMKRAGIVAVIAMGVISAIFIEKAGAAAKTDVTSAATLSPVTTIDYVAVLVTLLVGVVARPKKPSSAAGSRAGKTIRWPVRISVSPIPSSSLQFPNYVLGASTRPSSSARRIAS